MCFLNTEPISLMSVDGWRSSCLTYMAARGCLATLLCPFLICCHHIALFQHSLRCSGRNFTFISIALRFQLEKEDSEGIQDTRLQNMPLRHADYSELKALEQRQIQGEASSEPPYMPKDRSSKRNSIVINPFLGRFIEQGHWLLPEDRRLAVDIAPRRTLPHTPISLLYSPKGPFVFSKNHLLSPKRPICSLPFLF